MRVAAIDIGTNSVLLLVAEAGASGRPQALLERATITRLGQGVDKTRELAPEAVRRTLDCLRGYAAEIAGLGVTRMVAVGTSAMRDAQGGEAFALAAEALLGVRPEVISGEHEARLTFAGALSGLSFHGPVVVFDVGGGSTEIVVGVALPDGPQILSSVSLNVGSVRLTERHLHSDPPTAPQLAALSADVDRELESLSALPPEAMLVGVAGTVTTLAAVHAALPAYDGARVHGTRLGLAELDQVTARLSSVPLAERKKIAGLDPGRADVIVGGAVLVQRLLRWAGVTELRVSDRGVRWGLILDALAGSSESPSAR